MGRTRHISIDDAALDAFARELAATDFAPVGTIPLHIPEGEVGQYVMLDCSQHFAFTDPVLAAQGLGKAAKFSTAGPDGKNYRRSMAVAFSMRGAMEAGVPLLDAAYFESMSEADVRSLFAGRPEMPRVPERAAIFNEIGRVLRASYGGEFRNMAAESAGVLYSGDAGKPGFVERLTAEMPLSFGDSFVFEWGRYYLDKKATLGGAMVARAGGPFVLADLAGLPVSPDYILPNALREKGVLAYAPALAEKLDAGITLEAGGREFFEMQGLTVAACHGEDGLLAKVNGYREPDAG